MQKLWTCDVNTENEQVQVLQVHLEKRWKYLESSRTRTFLLEGDFDVVF